MSRRPSSPSSQFSSNNLGPPSTFSSRPRPNRPTSVLNAPSSAAFGYEPTSPPPSRPERSMRRPPGDPSPAMRGGDGFSDRDYGHSSTGSHRYDHPADGASGRGSDTEAAYSPRTDGQSSQTTSAAMQVDSGHSKSRRMMESLNMRAPSPMTAQPSTTDANGSTSRRQQLRRDSLESLSSERSSAAVGSLNRGEDRLHPSLQQRRPSYQDDQDRQQQQQQFEQQQQEQQEKREQQQQRRSERKKPKAAIAAVLDPREYPDTAAFREIEGVLRKIRTDWPIIVQDSSSEDMVAGSTGGEYNKFDPVTLALSLLNPATVGTPVSLIAFNRLKAELDHAISTTLSSSSTSFRAYESSITTYNSTLVGLGNNVKKIGELRKGLMESKEKLEGKGREGLVGMYHRLGHLEEMVQILDEIDHLRSVPDRLEALLSEKRFLSAVILLVRSTKTINKPEMMDIGAVSDLRGWMTAQEGVLLEILIEELHNHLYLKSFYCEVRWKAYNRGQTSLPTVDFGDDAAIDTTSLLDPSRRKAADSSSPQSSSPAPKLQRYLNSLALRPSHNPMIDEPVDVFVSRADDSESIALELVGTSFPVSSAPIGSSTASPRPNLELDSFAYLEGLLESLGVLGKLGVGLDAVSQRVRTEVYNLVESTLEEVEERNDALGQGMGSPRHQTSFFISSGSTPHASAPIRTVGRSTLSSLVSLSLSRSAAHRSSLLRLSADESNELESNVETLKDLFWTLFSKLDAVLQGFRVVHEVSSRMVERRDFKDSSMTQNSASPALFSLIEVWKPVQEEVRSLLHDYLTDDDNGTVSSRNPIISVAEVLRTNKSGRDHSKQMFKFADSDIKASSKALKSHEEELNRALKIAVPGLMTEASIQPGQSAILASLMTDDRYNAATGTSAASNANRGTHKPLVVADAFNVSVLIGPTLSFLDRAQLVMPDGLISDNIEEEGVDNSFGGFLDDFVLRTFLPQLEAKVTSVFHQAVGGLDAFQEDPDYKRVSNVPIVKSVSNLTLLISSLCSMLRSTLFHRENYSHLIVSVIHQFHQRCVDRYKDLTTHETSDEVNKATEEDTRSMHNTSAAWAELPVINACMVEIREIDESDVDRMEAALKRETKVELEEKGRGPVLKRSLITSSKRILALGILYSSLDWFIVQVSSLKSPSDDTASSSAEFNNASTTRSDQHDDADDPQNFSLPLTRQMTQAFDTLLERYQQLADLVLFTLRLETRLRTMHYLDKASREGVYQLTEDTAEPDAAVVDLNTDLADFDECVAMTLASAERRFIFEGLSLFMDHLLISNSRHIRLANQNGLAKMMRNILALQQNLKNIGDTPLEVNFDRSRKFWEVFGRGPAEMIESIRSEKISYDFEDYKSLLNLMCGIDQSSKDDPTSAEGPISATASAQSRRMYNEYLIELFALDEPKD